MDISILEEIGLSNTEVKVFLALLGLGESKAIEIIRKSKLQSSSMYNALNHLIEKGFVAYIKKHKIKYYKCSDPETILKYLELKKSEFLRILPELKEKQKKVEKEGVEFYKSYKGIKTLFLELLKDGKKGDIYRSIAFEEKEEYIKASEKLFAAAKSLVKEKKIITKVITHEKTRKPKDKKTKTIFNKRYVDFPLLPNTLIFKDKTAIISWTDEPSGILIHSKDIAEKYSKFFDHLWKLGKK